MKNFVAICAKNGQRIELSVQKASIDEARAELHSQGYSIIEIRESEAGASSDTAGTPFYFEILVNGQKKNGQIRSTDMFRAYVKLVDGLNYEVLSIYDDPSASEEDRRFITNKVYQTYLVYKGKNQSSIKKEPKEEKKPTTGTENVPENTSILARRVARYHALIERVVEKIEELLTKYPSHIDENKTFLLKELAVKIRQLKNLANPDKLYQVLEAALNRIGQLEIELIEKNVVSEKKEFLRGTNILLKELGSSKKIILAEEDFVNQARLLWKGFSKRFLSEKEKTSNDPATSNEFLFFKNLRELAAYKEKRKEVGLELISGIFSLRWERRERLKLKFRLIEQNIALLNNRIKNRSSSYVKMKRGVSVYSSALFYLLRSIGDFLLYSLLVYTISHAVFSGTAMFLGFSNTFPHIQVFILSVGAFMAFFLKQIRSFHSAVIGCVCMAIFFAFLGVNF